MIPATENVAFIIAAYAAAWIMMIGYSIHLFRAVARARAAYAAAQAAAGEQK